MIYFIVRRNCLVISTNLEMNHGDFYQYKDILHLLESH